MFTERSTKACRQGNDRLSASLAGGPLFLGYAPRDSRQPSPTRSDHQMDRQPLDSKRTNMKRRRIFSPSDVKHRFECRQSGCAASRGANKEMIFLRSSSVLLRCKCQVNPQPSRLALHPCLLAAMRCETITPTKTHLDLHHTQHHPSHPISASGPVSRRSGSIDGPSFFSSSLLEPSSQSLASTMILALLDVKLFRMLWGRSHGQRHGLHASLHVARRQ
jgi:hypothetical protein